MVILIPEAYATATIVQLDLWKNLLSYFSFNLYLKFGIHFESSVQLLIEKNLKSNSEKTFGIYRRS